MHEFYQDYRICRNPREEPKAPQAFYDISEIIQNTLDLYNMTQYRIIQIDIARIRERQHRANIELTDTPIIHSIHQGNINTIRKHIITINTLMEQIKRILTQL